MKKNTAYTIGSLIVLLICAFCFVILPAFTGSDAKQSKSPSFGKYNGKEIAYEQGTDFANFVSQYGQMFQSYGQQMDSSTYYYVFNYAFNSTVLKYAYEDAIKTSGYTAPKSAVTRKLIPYFSDENGNYSSKIYKQTDEATIRELRSSIEQSIYSERYYDDNFGSDDDIVGTEALYGIKESDAELDFLSAFGENKRGFHMAAFSLNDYPEEEKIKFLNENKAKFNVYDLSILTVDDKSTAASIVKRINNFEITFEDAISEYSTKNYSNSEGKLTYTYQYQIENILGDKADISILADMADDTITDVIATQNGFSIFKKNNVNVAPDYANEDIQSIVTSYLKNYESTRIEDYFVAKAKDFTNEAMKTSFADACTSLSIENVEIAPFPLNYGSVNLTQSVDTSITGLTGADENENFLKTAFALKKNEISAPVVMNNYVIVLQYSSDAEPSDETKTVAVSDIKSYDEDASSSFFMNSDKLENNFSTTYFQYMMGN